MFYATLQTMPIAEGETFVWLNRPHSSPQVHNGQSVLLDHMSNTVTIAHMTSTVAHMTSMVAHMT